VDDVTRWSIEQVVALAARSTRFAAGEAIAVPTLWSHTGAGDRAVWGRYDGSSAEPYDVVVEHVAVVSRCTCPSRVVPCKHVVGLLVLWVRGHVPRGPEPVSVTGFADRAGARMAAPGAGNDGAGPADPSAGAPAVGAGAGPLPVDASGGDEPGPAPTPTEDSEGDRDGKRNERIERLLAGLVELTRWIEDRLRTGLADPQIARFATWDELAARLTDARASALANRVRRLAGRVGTSPDWHADVLAELGILHLIAAGGRRVPELPDRLADTVAVACGWQVRSADVAGSAPETDTWLVAGRSDVREDLIEVRRQWLYGTTSRRWALALSFAAYRQSLDTSLEPGTAVVADLHRYPGGALRVIVGERYGDPFDGSVAAIAAAGTVRAACEVLGRALAAEPWLERVPLLLTAAPTSGDGGWVLTDHTGSLPLAPVGTADADALAVLLGASGGAPLPLAVEWTADGLVPLTAFLADRTLDLGRRADTSFVSAA
jgi:hypothetical protein